MRNISQYINFALTRLHWDFQRSFPPLWRSTLHTATKEWLRSQRDFSSYNNSCNVTMNKRNKKMRQQRKWNWNSVVLCEYARNLCYVWSKSRSSIKCVSHVTYACVCMYVCGDCLTKIINLSWEKHAFSLHWMCDFRRESSEREKEIEENRQQIKRI